MNLPSHRTAEEYYEALKNRAIPVPTPCGSGAGNPHPSEGGLSEEKGISEVERKLIQKNVAEEAAKAKGRGRVPAALLRWAEEVLNPKVDWKKLLLQLVRGACAHSNLAKLDYTFRKPSRRSGEFILPSLRTDVPKVALVVDTSGSISGRDISQFKAEVLAVLKLVGKLELVTCDAKAQRAKVNGPWEGGGGTDLRVGIELALKSRPDVVVVLTDGLTPWPESPLPVPLIVATTDREGPPWARTVRIGD
jgi:predicted metal-dependent peptidase